MFSLDYVLFRQYFFAVQWIAVIAVITILKVTDLSVAAVSFFAASLFLLMTYLNYISYTESGSDNETKTSSAQSCEGKGLECYAAALESDVYWRRYKAGETSFKPLLLNSYGHFSSLRTKIDSYNHTDDSPTIGSGLADTYLALDEYVSSLSGIPGVPWSAFVFICFIVLLYMAYQWTDADFINKHAVSVRRRLWAPSSTAS